MTDHGSHEPYALSGRNAILVKTEDEQMRPDRILILVVYPESTLRVPVVYPESNLSKLGCAGQRYTFGFLYPSPKVRSGLATTGNITFSTFHGLQR